MRATHYQADNNLRKAKYERALRQYLDITKVESKNAYAYQGASLALSHLGRYDEAYELANKALGIDSSLVLPHVVLAYAYDEFGEQDKSQEEASIALKLDPESADVLCCFGVVLLINGNLELASEYLEKAVVIDPSNYLAQYNLAVIYQTLDEKKLFNQTFTLFRLKPNVRNIIKLLYLSVWAHRPFYFSLLLLSGLAAIFVGPKVILIITLLLVYLSLE